MTELPARPVEEAGASQHRGRAVRLSSTGPVAVVTIERPPVHVLDLATLGELAEALGKVPPHARALLLRSEGRAFCAGMDIADHLPDHAKAMLAAARRVFEALLAVPCPVVARVQGAALGGGAELLLACDLVLASTAARIGFPEIKVGAFPPLAAVLLPERVGWQRAFSLMALGDALSAEQACQWGLVTEAVEPGALDGRVEHWLERLCGEVSAPVVASLKRAASGVARASLSERLAEAERVYLGQLLSHRDAVEGLRAFQEKRPPAWQHR